MEEITPTTIDKDVCTARQDSLYCAHNDTTQRGPLGAIDYAAIFVWHYNDFTSHYHPLSPSNFFTHINSRRITVRQNQFHILITDPHLCGRT